MLISQPFALLRRAALSLRRAPGFTALCVVTLAVGIGAMTAVFSLVDAVLLQPLPYRDAGWLVAVDQTLPKLEIDEAAISEGLYLFYLPRQHSFAGLALYGNGDVNLCGGTVPERVAAARVTASLFPTLGAAPRLGRAIGPADDRPGAPRVALISDGLWHRQLGGDPHVVGRVVRVDGVPTQVIGVMPPGFSFPALHTAVWLPMRIDPAKAQLGSLGDTMVGRLAPGATPAGARADLDRLAATLDRESREPAAKILVEGGLAARVRPLRDIQSGDIGPTLWMLLGAVAIVLAIACANVANLLIVYGDGRRRELAIYTALGAPRRLLIGGVLAESMLIGAAAGAGGVALAWGGVRLLSALRPAALADLPPPAVNGRVLAFAVVVSLATSLLFGLVPAWRASARQDLTAELKGTGRALTAGRGRQRLRQLLAGVQLALALVLLTGAALMLRSFRHLAAADVGFQPRGALVFDLALPATFLKQDAAALRFWERLLDRLRALPGVTAVGAATNVPLWHTFSRTGHLLENSTVPAGAPPVVIGIKMVSEGYLHAMGTPLLAGRDLERGDADRRNGAALVSAALARRRWPGGALGKRLLPGVGSKDSPWYTVVGVVGDVHEKTLAGAADETVYYSLVSQTPNGWLSDQLTVVVRGAASPATLLPAVRREVAALAPDLPMANVATLDEVVHQARAAVEFAALMVLIATAVAVLLGAVGLYGFISYLVGQRTAEIGIRMALGATDHAVRWLVVREALLTAMVSVALGLGAATALSRYLASVLVGVGPRDPLSFVAAPLLLVLVTLFASYLPADRAVRIEPLLALRRVE